MSTELPGVSPQSATGSRRIQAAQKRKRAADEPINLTGKLFKRQLGCGSVFEARRARRQDGAEAFRNMRLQGEYDSLDAQRPTALALQSRRSEVSEIIAAAGMFMVLCRSGTSSAFDRVSGKRLCHLNVLRDEVIRSLFWNKLRRCLITVSVHQADNYSSLKCRSMPAECIWRGRPQDADALFDDAALQWPGFVEFDDVNSKVLTYNAADRVYTVYGLEGYQKLYSLDHGAVQEVKISPGILLMVMERKMGANGSEHVPLQVHHIEDGALLKEFRHPLAPGHKPEFIELFNSALVVKQEGQPLRITDVLQPGGAAVAAADFPTPAAFIFLYERDLFLSLLQHTVAVWNFQGQQVSQFQDHTLLRPDSHVSNVYINQRQDLIVSWCKPVDIAEAPAGGPAACLGTINVSCLLTGRCIAKVAAAAAPQSDAERATQAALQDVTALFLDEEHGDVYTGNVDGFVHKWSR